MDVRELSLPGVFAIEPKVYGDERGFFMESWHRQRYQEAGLVEDFVQDNVSRSSRGILRGLHFQHPQGQGKLVSVLEGEIFDVAVDIRVGSPNFGRWAGETLSSENHLQLFIPAGFAHGFYVVSENALVAYKCTALYNPEAELSIAWNDPGIGIEWPAGEPRLSAKDTRALPLAQIPPARLPVYGVGA